MNICRIVSQLNFGGVEQRLKFTSDFFQDYVDHKLIILVLGKGGKISREIENMGFSVTILDENVKIPNFVLIKKVCQFLRLNRPDVIHTSGAEANFHGLVAGFLVQTPVRIGEEIGFPNHGQKFRLTFKFIYSLSHQVIAISKAVAQRIVALNEISNKKITVIYNPVSISQRQLDLRFKTNFKFSLTESNSHKIFVTTCRLVPIKNLKFLINVFYEYTKTEGNDNSVLWIIGDGPEKEMLVELTHRYKIFDKVKFFGYINNVIPFLKKAHIFILPSFSEGFSISLVEAMLCGLPVISTKVGGPSEIVSHGINGFLFDPKDPFQLITLMEKLSKLNKEELSEIKLNAIKKGAEFSVENYGKSLVKLYSSFFKKNNTGYFE